MPKGLFIVFYGINNLGKTTQAKLLVERFKKEGYQTEYLKYGIYDLQPSGPVLDDYLRHGNPFNLTPREFQIVHVLNRTQYQPQLLEKLNRGINIVAEDYIGTGLAWGIGAGVDEKFLKQMNTHLIRENLAFLFQGQRFSDGIETNHRHEQDDELTEKVRLAHEKLADEFGWIRINANQPIEVISQEIWEKVVKVL